MPNEFNIKNGFISNAYSLVKGVLNISGNTTSTGEIRGLILRSTQSSGDEGGQLDLSTPQTNSTISGGTVSIDIYQNKIRFFETGGSNRGAYIDLTSASVGVGSNLLSGGGGETNTASNLGSGTGLFAQKSGVDLQFKSLTSTGGTINISNNATTVNIEATSTGGGGTFTGGTVPGPTIFTGGLSAFTNSTTWISGATSTDLVRITQSGSGNAFVVEDSANPDSTPFVISNTGSVGIGLTSPSVPLHIKAAAQASTNENIIRLEVSDASNAYLAFNNAATADNLFVAEIVGRQSSSTDQPAIYQGGYIDTTQDTGTNAVTVFRSALATLAPISTRPLFDFKNWSTSVMTIAADGDVGIGTSTPSAKLHVNNTTTGTTVLFEDSTNPDFTPFIIDSVGRVGIGTQTPVNWLTIESDSENNDTGVNINLINTGVLNFGTEKIGLGISVAGAASNFAIQLQDGSEGFGKFLYSVTSDGKTRWTNNLSGQSFTITTTPTNNNNNTQILTRNSTTGRVEYVDGNGPVGAYNYGMAYTMLTGNYMI